MNISFEEVVLLTNSKKDTKSLNILESFFKLVDELYTRNTESSKVRMIHKVAELLVKHYDDKTVVKLVGKKLI